MDKKGFTLVELLLTIVVIGIIAVLGIAVYNGLSERSRQRLYDSTVALIETKSENWADSIELKEPITITVNRLVVEGFFDADDEAGNVNNPIYNPSVAKSENLIKGTKYLNCFTVFIDYQDGKASAKYTGEENCTLSDTEGYDANIKISAKEVNIPSGVKQYFGTGSGTNNVWPWTRHDVEITATAEIYGDTIESYQWYQNGNTIDGETKNKITVTSTHLLDAKYKVRLEIKNSDGTTSMKFQEVQIRIDKEKPTKPEVSTSSNNNWVNTNPITATIKSTDLASGVNKYQYCVVNVLKGESIDICKDSNNWKDFGTVNGPVFNMTITNSDVNNYGISVSEVGSGKGLDIIMYFKSLDKVDNASDTNVGGDNGLGTDDGVRFRIDTSKPELQIENIWHNIWAPEPYPVTLTGTEPGGSDIVKSGISHYEYCLEATSGACDNASNWVKYEYSATSPYITPNISKDGRYLFRAYDNAGNVSNTVETIVKIFKRETFVYGAPGDYLFKAKSRGIYAIELWGASGGGAGSGGATGGYVSAKLTLEQGQEVYIYVGGAGGGFNSNCWVMAGGYNGGGSRGAIDNGSVGSCGAGGGGATDARIGGTTLYNRFMVAAGGGGAGYGAGAGGSNAGGHVGQDSFVAGTSDDNCDYSCFQNLRGRGASLGGGGGGTGAYYAQWGTNQGRSTGSPGWFGQGGSGGNNSWQFHAPWNGSGGGGGGGWYGGGGGGGADSLCIGGGGGSSCAYGSGGCDLGSGFPTLTNHSVIGGGGTFPAKNAILYDENTAMMGGGNVGNGYAKISALQGL